MKSRTDWAPRLIPTVAEIATPNLRPVEPAREPINTPISAPIRKLKQLPPVVLPTGFRSSSRQTGRCGKLASPSPLLLVEASAELPMAGSTHCSRLPAELTPEPATLLNLTLI